MGRRLKLRRGVVVSAEPLEVEIDGERRRAWADEVLLGEMREGDEVVVNTAALDLSLGSGGFDVVHVNLTRGLEGEGEGDAHVMKLNYTSLQHPVDPIERPNSRFETDEMRPKGSARSAPVAVLPLHGHLAPAAWAAAQAAPGLRVGYVQTGGGALPGSFSRDVKQLRERGLLADHITAAPAYGGEHEALSTVGALDAAATELNWDAILIGPGPGIIGSDTAYGHGGMAALENAHAALSLCLPTLISPRLSSADPRDRHRGLSHHTRTVLQLLLAPVEVPVPAGYPEVATALEPFDHQVQQVAVDLEGYAAADLPTTTMGRSLQEDPLFFAAALAAGRLLAERVAGRGGPPQTLNLEP
ncbi:MAG TPA: DUF3866 family protein [Solirubrobacterales bacterium]|nr:DUF3866 family protein [Solirubrobacterales bacterium]